MQCVRGQAADFQHERQAAAAAAAAATATSRAWPASADRSRTPTCVSPWERGPLQ